MRKKNLDKRLVYILTAAALLAAISIAALGTGAGALPTGPQPGYAVHQYDGGPTHAYIINASVGPINVRLGGAIYGTPTIYRGILFVTTMGNLTELQDSRYDLVHGTVSAINIGTGRIIWQDTMPNQVMTQPVIAGDLVVVGMGNNGEVPEQYKNNINSLTALNQSTGAVVWNVTETNGFSTGPDLATPAYDNGLLIEAGSRGAAIYNASTGLLTGVVHIGLPDVLSSPLLVNGTAYFGAGVTNAYGYKSFNESVTGAPINVIADERFTAVNLTTGNIVWQDRVANAGAGLNDVCAAYSDGIVVAAYLNQSDYEHPTVIAFNSSTGKVLWEINETRFAAQHGFSSTPGSTLFLNYTQNTVSPVTIWNGTAYVNSNFLGYLIAVNISTGTPLWAVNTGQDESNPNVFYGHYLITINDAGELYIIDARNGGLVNATYIGMPHLAAEPIITNNYAILAGMDGRIVSLPLASLIKPNYG